MTRYGSLFSGVGGLDLAVEALTGASCAWHVENDPHASKVLAHHWPGVPNHGDITAIDWTTVEPVDVLCGGFPCQDISSAGRGAGIKEGTRSGLWYRYTDAIRVLRPRLVLVENVSALLVRGLDIVAGSLAELGYDAEWLCLRASDVGACHQRRRLFLMAAPTDADNGALYRQWARPEPGRRSVEAADLDLLPTPSAGNFNDGEDVEQWQARRARVKEAIGNGNGFGMPLSIAVQLLPTPTSSLGGSRGTPNRETARRRLEDEGRRCLDDAVALLPTPTATDCTGSRGHRRDGTAYGPTSGVTLTDAIDADRWGKYAAAIARHEHAFGRPAPEPRDDKGRLNPLLSEWMMGLPQGWITDILERRPALRAAGNGVVPQQALTAYRMLAARAQLSERAA